LLRTELGVVYWVNCPNEIKDEPSRETIDDNEHDYASENEAEWRVEAPAWAI
jgi:hypothetical protein